MDLVSSATIYSALEMAGIGIPQWQTQNPWPETAAIRSWALHSDTSACSWWHLGQSSIFVIKKNVPLNESTNITGKKNMLRFSWSTWTPLLQPLGSAGRHDSSSYEETWHNTFPTPHDFLRIFLLCLRRTGGLIRPVGLILDPKKNRKMIGIRGEKITWALDRRHLLGAPSRWRWCCQRCNSDKLLKRMLT